MIKQLVSRFVSILTFDEIARTHETLLIAFIIDVKVLVVE